MDLGQIAIIYVTIGIGTYWREVVNIHENYKTKKKSDVPIPKPSAKVVFGTAFVSTILLFFLNLIILKFTDIPLVTLSFIFGWFGYDIGAVVRRDPLLIIEWIPGVGKSIAESIRKNKTSSKDPSPKDDD